MLTKLVPNALRTHGTSGPTNLLLSGENVQLNLSDDAAPQEVILKLVHHAVAPESQRLHVTQEFLRSAQCRQPFKELLGVFGPNCLDAVIQLNHYPISRTRLLASCY